MNDGTKIRLPAAAALLRELKQLHEAGSPLSPMALAELHAIVDAAIERSFPLDCRQMSPEAAWQHGWMHGQWHKLRAWLESVQ